MTDSGMVIVGAGETGARAAVELRTQGWSGPITLIGQEKWSPYERPPLSKSTLVADGEASPVHILDDEKFTHYNINFISNTLVTKIDSQSHTAELVDGRRLRYERLLLATGAYPRRLSIEGSDSTGVLYLRSFSDALTLRARLQPGKHIAVIGGGFIGLEVAASARQRGCSVTLVEVGARILMRGVPAEIAGIVEAIHRKAGVKFKFGVAISRIESSLNSQTITFTDGTFIHCDTIVAGIGAVPETTLAATSGLKIDNGVCVDEMLATSDQDIFAAGDCCSFPHVLYAGKRIRLEAWRNAQDQGTHAARNMLGPAEPYKHIPWFWSDQFDQTLQVVGLPEYGIVTVKRDMGDAGKLFFHLCGDGRLVATSGVGASIAKDIRLAEMLIQQQAKPDPKSLENPTVKLKTLLHS